jgi:hypothetical protein
MSGGDGDDVIIEKALRSGTIIPISHGASKKGGMWSRGLWQKGKKARDDDKLIMLRAWRTIC